MNRQDDSAVKLKGEIGKRISISIHCVNVKWLLRTTRKRVSSKEELTSVTTIVAGRIGLEEQRLAVFVADQHHARAVRSHAGVLRVDLCDVRHSSGEGLDRDVVAELVLEIRCLILCPLHLSLGVRHQTGHTAADRRSDAVEVGDRFWVQQLVRHFLLCDHHGRIGT